jgi:hypothetical protein
MAYKVIMTWDITPEHEQEYFEFVVREFIPGLQRMGLELTDAWATIYGTQPQIMVGAALPSLAELQKIIKGNDWVSLNNQLQVFVHNYQQKIVQSQGGYQL